jgi:transposase, IS30 family
VEARRVLRHWEIDTVHGTGRGACTLSAVERKTGFVELGKLARATGAAFAARAVFLFRRHAGRVKTITADNGSEMTGYPTIEEATGAVFYFANPTTPGSGGRTRTRTVCCGSTCRSGTRWRGSHSGM